MAAPVQYSDWSDQVSEPGRVHAHGVVAVDADAQAQLARELAHRAQLLGREPLQVAMEIHLVGVFVREAPHGLAAGRAVFLGPVVPARAGAVMAAKIAVDRIEQRVQAHRLAAFAQERAAGRGARGVAREMFGAKALERRLQHGHLEAGDRRDSPPASRRAPAPAARETRDRAMMACARREPCTSSTAATSMNITFSAWRLDAEYGEYSVGIGRKQRVHRD